ncbi:hypothetical protein [Hydrogenophaga sp. BPS33]|uniref:hypothetical protein n=1 Tax=Hydrogenophaga sp. BPS33 TaxID=2651974 RepID=UPI00132020DF|nr:hypothetical protein [Hydrogenophaga sp. BPS33]QHE85321.1 hypothetical protein F9K07_10650 [Hydrogenophaga sp. BPS33]
MAERSRLMAVVAFGGRRWQAECGQKRTVRTEQVDTERKGEMAGPTMSEEKYRALTKRQRVAYWVALAAVAAFIAYMLFVYRQ